MSGPKTPTKGLAIIWAGDLTGGVAARNRYREQGFVARVVDANEWHRGPKVEPCSLLVFCAARLQADIEAAYRAAGYAGEIVVLGADGNPVVNVANTAMSKSAQRQPTRQQVETPPPAPPPPPPPPPAADVKKEDLNGGNADR